MNTTRYCLIIGGPKCERVETQNMVTSLNMSDIPVVTIGLSRRGAFNPPATINIGGIIVVGSPNISINGLHEMFSLTPIVVIGRPPGGDNPVSDIQYVRDWQAAVVAIDDEMFSREVDLSQFVLPPENRGEDSNPLDIDASPNTGELNEHDKRYLTLIPLDERERQTSAA